MRRAEFSADHDWRLTMETLKSLPSRLDVYKRVAAKYLQYVGGRRAPTGFNDGAVEDSVVRTWTADSATLEQTGPQVEFRSSAASSTGNESYQRIPKGETLEFEIAAGASIDLKLASHKFSLIAANPFRLADQSGVTWRLDGHVTLVGRGQSCDVVIDSELLDVSRCHLIIETVGDQAVQLTDLSSHGTFILEGHLRLAHPALPYHL
jgi:hypothetical protein